MSDYQNSSGNVFSDLGFSLEEAEELEVKSALIRQISAAIEDHGMKQIEAASLIGVDQPTLSKVLRGRMGSITVERLTGWLNKLGYDVKMTVTKKPGSALRGHFSVALNAM